MSRRRTCGTCGQVHDRCSAHRKGSTPPAPCRAWPAEGARTCRVHGSATDTARRAARRRVVEREAEAVVRRILGEAAPAGIDDPAGVLADLAARLRAALDALGVLVEERGRVSARSANGGEDVVSELRAWLAVAGELRQSLGILMRADLDERRLRIEEAKGRQIAEAWRALVDALAERLALDPSQRAAAHSEAVAVLRRLAAGEFAA